MILDKNWAVDYCNRIMKDNKITFPFQLARKKVGGYVDSLAVINNVDDFYIAYQEFDSHPRCSAILLYHDKLDRPVSV